MGKHERIAEINADLYAALISEGIVLSKEIQERCALFIYHRELALRKIIKCMLWDRSMGCAFVTLEAMSESDGVIYMENTDGTLEIRADLPTWTPK